MIKKIFENMNLKFEILDKNIKIIKLNNILIKN